MLTGVGGSVTGLMKNYRFTPLSNDPTFHSYLNF